MSKTVAVAAAVAIVACDAAAAANACADAAGAADVLKPLLMLELLFSRVTRALNYAMMNGNLKRIAVREA